MYVWLKIIDTLMHGSIGIGMVWPQRSPKISKKGKVEPQNNLNHEKRKKQHGVFLFFKGWFIVLEVNLYVVLEVDL